MKIINEFKNNTIILDDKEEIFITNAKMHTRIKIKSIGNTLFIDEKCGNNIIIEEEEEQKAIEAMDNYLDENK